MSIPYVRTFRTSYVDESGKEHMHSRKPRQGNLVAGGGWAGHGPIGLSAAVSLPAFGVRVRSVQFGFFRARSVS